MRLRREEERAFPGGRRGNRHVAETWARAVSTSRHLPLTPTLEGGPNFHKRGRSERAEALSVAGWTQCPGSCCCPTHPACSPVTSRCRCRTANPDPSPILETVSRLGRSFIQKQTLRISISGVFCFILFLSNGKIINKGPSTLIFLETLA